MVSQPNKKRNFVYLFSILIFSIGFLLRTYNSTWEPYPAVLMPVGANTAKINDQLIEANRSSLLVSSGSKENWQLLDGSSFMADRTFKTFRLISSNFKIFQKTCESKEVIDAKAWLRKELKLNNLPHEFIRLKKSKVNMDRNTGLIINERIESDLIVNLNACN